MKKIRQLQKGRRVVRIVVLLLVLATSTTLGLLHQYGKGWTPAGVDAFCPFGGIESAITLITTGAMLSKIAWSSFILLFATLIVAVLFRRSFCGSLCPLGTLQELFGRAGKKIFKKRLEVPAVLDKPARYIKYIVLVVFVVLSAILGELAIRPYDPWATYHHLFSSDLFTEFSIGFAVLAVSLAGSFFVDRFFCKYLCPMGAFLGLINRIGLFRIRRNDTTCIHCHACNKACPVNIKVEETVTVDSSECIACSECVNVCPVENTLFIEGPKKSRVSPFTVTTASFLIFAAVIGAATITGGFEWTLKTLEETTGEQGAFNPDDIKGRDTFRQVSELSGVDAGLIMEHFSITEEQFDKPIRDASHEDGSGFETEDVREFIRQQLKDR
ncbi:MAG: 4Fe-4S binding protein [Spirochaetales bacterium]|nr:4Fe-4S binding protein [Spirochaetales bacterium]